MSAVHATTSLLHAPGNAFRLLNQSLDAPISYRTFTNWRDALKIPSSQGVVQHWQLDLLIRFGRYREQDIPIAYAAKQALSDWQAQTQNT